MTNLSVILLFGLAALAANLPFWTGRKRLFGLVTLENDKSFFVMMLECLLSFGLWMGFALWLESSQQTIHVQHWQFWVVSVCIFVLLAFPGFIWRYLWPRHK